MNDDRKTWKLKASSGLFRVWHAGRNLYYVTHADGPVLYISTQFSPAYAAASRYHRTCQGAAA